MRVILFNFPYLVIRWADDTWISMLPGRIYPEVRCMMWILLCHAPFPFLIIALLNFFCWTVPCLCLSDDRKEKKGFLVPYHLLNILSFPIYLLKVSFLVKRSYCFCDLWGLFWLSFMKQVFRQLLFSCRVGRQRSQRLEEIQSVKWL